MECHAHADRFSLRVSSKDGAQWSPGQASSLHSSTGPAALLKMPDRRLLIFWNNCEMPPKFEGKRSLCRA